MEFQSRALWLKCLLSLFRFTFQDPAPVIFAFNVFGAVSSPELTATSFCTLSTCVDWVCQVFLVAKYYCIIHPFPSTWRAHNWHLFVFCL